MWENEGYIGRLIVDFPNRSRTLNELHYKGRGEQVSR